ncbi:MAG: corrinoid protein [Candidatus Omnitrophota bacterium]
MTDFTLLHKAIKAGSIGEVPKLVERAIGEGAPIKAILDDGLIFAMGEIGERFKNNEIFIPEVLISAKAMQAGMKILEPYIATSDIKPAGKVVVGTVKGDLHDIGKNIVGMMLKGAGFEVEDLGIDVAPQKFSEAVDRQKADIVALSCLITTSMSAIGDTIKYLSSRSQRESVKVIIGGAPITQEFSDTIGADGYAGDAASAVDKVKELLGI